MSCVCDKEICTGCQACYQFCMEQNITMVKGFDGFLYAEIINKNKDTCKNCTFTCPQLKINKSTDPFPKVFAVQLNDEKKLTDSTSGGMFYAVADYVLKHGGVVFGAIYEEDMTVRHKVAFNKNDLVKMHGSKYVQSDITGIYKEVLNYLDKNIFVLLTGTPCQIAGLKAYLQKDYMNLITMDVICSGVPSPLLFSKYIEHLQKKRIKVLDYKFRDKSKYGCSHTVVITFIDRKAKKRKQTIPDRRRVSYYVAFGKENCFMTACYHCRYNTVQRVSDFTVGGFWGLKHTDIKMDEKKGVSLVLVNTVKALSIMDWVKKIATVHESDIEAAVCDNRALKKTTAYSTDRDKIYNELNKSGYAKTASKYFKPTSLFVIRIKMVRRFIYYILDMLRN